MTGESNPTAATAPPSLFPTSQRASPFAQTLPNAMAPSAFMASSQSAFRPSLSAHSGIFPSPIASPFDRDPSRAVGAPLTSTSPPSQTAVRIHGLPPHTSEDALRLMTVFSKEVTDVQMLPPHSPDAPFRSALIAFVTPAGALEAKNILDGKPNLNNEGRMRVEIANGSPILARKSPSEDTMSSSGRMETPSATSSMIPSRGSSRFTTASPLENLPVSSLYGGDAPGLINEPTSAYQYRDQQPIGTVRPERAHVSGKSLISEDTADDDDTGAIMMNPIDFVENGSIAAQRRATAPQVAIDRMQGLSLNTSADITGSVPNLPYSHQGPGSMSARPSAMSPTLMSGPPSAYSNSAYPQSAYPHGPSQGLAQGRGGFNMPPVNPADMNPPCNTLYVGNLPIDTSEEELKTIFVRCRGYKRLCFRTKQNGPMCFVEFEDTSYAVLALQALYGTPLSNSVKGGIRLSFSKNPLGVRSGQNPNLHNGGGMNGMNGHMPGPGGAFSAASGPPPGLSAPPPGLSSRMSYNNGAGSGQSYGPGGHAFGANGNTNGGNPWGNGPMYGSAMTAGGGSNHLTNGGNSAYNPAMFGR